MSKEIIKEEKKVEEKVVSKFTELDSSSMVNGAKSLRAFNAIIGKAKGGTVEAMLGAKLRGEYSGQELFEAIYKELGGLVNKQKALVNRANEETDKKKKASR